MRSEPFKKDLAFPLTDDEARQRTLQHIELLADIDRLTQQKKDTTKEISETIKEKQKAARKLAKVVVDKIETRSVDVQEVADWETKRVITMRKGDKGEDIPVDTRGMTLEEQQQSLFNGKARKVDEADDDPEATKVAKDFDAALSTPPVTLSTKYRLVLEDAGEKPVQVVKALKAVFGTLGAAKSAVAAAPRIVLTTENQGEVEALARELEKLGATVTVKVPDVPVEEKKALPPAVRKVDAIKDAEKLPSAVGPETQAELEKKFRKGMGVDKVAKGTKKDPAPREPRERKSRK